MLKRFKTTNEFIANAIKIHDIEYDYSLVKYENMKTKVDIICHKHGIFSPSPESHLNKKTKCPKCVNIVRGLNDRKNIDEFINTAIKIHDNKYNYSKFVYSTAMTKSIIICNVCNNEFSQSPNKHLKGQGCIICSGCQHSNISEFINKSKNIHDDKYDYSKFLYINANKKSTIICNKCNESFQQSAHDHLRGRGCLNCSISKGEERIKLFLKNNDINYVAEHKFNSCKSNKGNKLMFDFYLPHYNLCIEYDGEQHFKSIKYFGGDVTLKNIRERDEIKNKYCLNNNINLIRIPYNEYKNIDNILKQSLNLHSVLHP